jgi:hypothetical protein
LLVRIRLRAKLDSLATRQLLVTALQVFHQYAPRHAINRQVMDHQQQSCSTPRAQLKQHHAQQWTCTQIQTALRSRRFRLDRRLQFLIAHVRKVQHCQRHCFVSVKACDLLTPTLFTVREAQSQRIMVSQQSCYQLSQ